MTHDERLQLCSAEVSLDGYPAKISGASNDFAYVTRFFDGLGCEWAWETAARIVASGGEFRT